MEKMPVEERIRRCIASGYFSNAVRMQPDGTFVSAGGGVVMWPHPSSVLFNRRVDWVVFNEVVETGRKVFVKDVSSLSVLSRFEKVFGMLTVCVCVCVCS